MTLQPGDRVRTSGRNPAGHTRLPHYLRAKPGVIEAVHGRYPLADERAAGRDVAECLYTVAFAGEDVWEIDAEPNCVIHAELWESYLVRR
ncbi:MAG: SH3-like domain-containing protein [Candidatus Velthaea sp.]|jgi:nitrile hydratase